MKLWSLVLGLAFIAACDSKPESAAKPAPPPAKETPSPMGDAPTNMVRANPEKPTPVPQEPGGRPSTEPPSREPLPQVQEFVVKPIEGEPRWPSPADEKEVARRGYLPFSGGYLYELVDDSGKITQSGAVVDGLILLDRGVVELLGCGSGGKEYESVLRLDGDVQGLDLSLSLIGLKRGPLPRRLADPKVMQGSRVVVLFQWETEDGKTVTHRAEDCVVNIQRKAPMPRVGWTYVGAMLPVPDPAGTPGRTYRVLAASGSRSLLTTYRDPSTLLDNPLFDAMDDSLYMANYMVLPQPGTKIRVVCRAPSETEKAEIQKIEEELK